METLKGGREVRVRFSDETDLVVMVKQITLRQYEEAFRAYSESEFVFVALTTGMTVDKVQSLEPDSYEELVAASEEVNARGFFVYYGRQNKKLIDRMNSVKPEVLRAAADAAKASNVTAPGLRPRRV